VVTTTFSASGIDNVEQLVNELYLEARLTTARRDSSVTITQSTVGSLVIGHVAYDATIDVDAGPRGAISIVHARSGHARYRSAGGTREWGPGDIYVSSDPADAFTSHLHQFDCDFVLFAPTLLADIAYPVHGDDGPVRLTGHSPVSAGAAERWLPTFAFIRDTAAQPDLPPLVLGGISRLLAAASLAAFPSNAQLDPTVVDRHDAHPVTVRRAIAFVETHPSAEVTTVDIALAASVTPRALQLAFRRHLGMTPMQYVRQVRLDLAHTDLLAADPATNTVGAIAARWGWARPSRFAAAYRAAYGRPPSATLRR
jgi:AraC-like DNA-binding protein